MKGPLASMIGAVKAIVDSRIALNGDLLISAVVDEEWASAGTEKLIEKYRADAVVVGEPTGGHVGVAHKGFVCLEIRVYGEAAHGSLSDTLGVNAVEMSAEILSKLRDLRRHYANKRHKLFGAPSIYAYFIQGGTNCSIVPDSCVIRVEKRTISSEDGIEAMNEIEAILKEPPLRKLGFRTDVVQLYERPPLDTSHNEPIVSSLLYAARLTLKNRPRVIGRPYWTDAALFSNKAHIPACLFGPGDLSRGHSSRECIDIREIINAAGAYALAATRFCGCWHQIKRNRIKTERTITAPIALA